MPARVLLSNCQARDKCSLTQKMKANLITGVCEWEKVIRDPNVEKSFEEPMAKPVQKEKTKRRNSKGLR